MESPRNYLSHEIHVPVDPGVVMQRGLCVGSGRTGRPVMTLFHVFVVPSPWSVGRPPALRRRRSLTRQLYLHSTGPETRRNRLLLPSPGSQRVSDSDPNLFRGLSVPSCLKCQKTCPVLRTKRYTLCGGTHFTTEIRTSGTKGKVTDEDRDGSRAPTVKVRNFFH